MNKITISLLCISALAISTAHASSDGTGSSSSVKIKVYKFAVSANADCSNPVTVIDNGTSADYVDFATSPDLGTGTIPTGTFPCVIMEISDFIKFTVGSSIGSSCATGTTYSIDVCRGETSKLIDGTSVTCNPTQGNEDRVSIYMSTSATATTGGQNATAFLPPTAGNEATQGLHLTAALVVSGDASGKFVADFTGQVESQASGGGCDCGPPAFGFK